MEAYVSAGATVCTTQWNKIQLVILLYYSDNIKFDFIFYKCNVKDSRSTMCLSGLIFVCGAKSVNY